MPMQNNLIALAQPQAESTILQESIDANNATAQGQGCVVLQHASGRLNAVGYTASRQKCPLTICHDQPL